MIWLPHGEVWNGIDAPCHSCEREGECPLIWKERHNLTRGTDKQRSAEGGTSHVTDCLLLT